MRIVVTGATGNVGTSVVRALGEAPEVEEIIGVARRRPELTLPKTRWRTHDVARRSLGPILDGADAVIHLAWLIQPSRNERVTRSVNVDGSRRVFAAAARAKVRTLIFASSVGTYAPGPKDRRVDESWPATGIATSAYSREKSRCEAMLDDLEAEHPALRVVRMRPGLTFKREAASEIRRLFVGPLLPNRLVRPGLLPVLPLPDGLRIQALHADDLAQAYVEAVRRDVRGAFNLAADPVLEPARIARALGTRSVPAPAAALRGLAGLTWRAHLQPTSPGWLDLALGVPLMDCGRAERELGFAPRFSSEQSLTELISGLRSRDGGGTPPLAADAGGPGRIGEFLTGVGGRA